MKTTWNVLRGFLSAAIRIFIETFHRLVINIFDTLFGFLNWPKKTLRIKILILSDKGVSVISPNDLQTTIDFARRAFSKNFNIELLPHQNGFVEVLHKSAPPEVLYTKGGAGALQEEFKNAGKFFATHLSGYIYPVTTFVVINISNATGCSLGPLTDYVTVSPEGAKDASTLAHELAHACGLWHIDEKSNLLWPYSSRSDKIKWWQKNIFRSSRHVTYW